MPNLAMGPVMPDIMALLNSQANLAETQVSTELRQQALQTAKDNAAQRQRTQQILMEDLAGGPTTGADKTNLPSNEDNPVAAAQKQLKLMQAESTKYAQLATDIRAQGGDEATADQFESQANQARERAISLSREMRLEQANQLKERAAVASTARDPESFNAAMSQMKAIDPDVDKKYQWDRDIDGNPVWGPKSARTMDVFNEAGMTADQRRKFEDDRDGAAEKAEEKKAKLDKEKSDAKYADSRAALEGIKE